MKVGIAIPAFNEEKNIGNVLNQLNNMGYENVLVIDGLSKDGTLKVAVENDYLDSDVLVLMDADGSMSAEEVPRFVEALAKGADVAKGSRFIDGGGTYDITVMRRFGNTVMTSIVNFVVGSNYSDLCYGFVALNKKAIHALAPILESNNFEIETELFIKAKKLGLNVVEVPSIEYERQHGKSNLNTFRDGCKIFKTIAAASINQ
jgi:glycosyltransferase involved in cell wall biosynthesis